MKSSYTFGFLAVNYKTKKVPYKPPLSNLVTTKNCEAQMVGGELGYVHVQPPHLWREGVTVHSATGYQQEKFRAQRKYSRLFKVPYFSGQLGTS